MLTKGLSSKWRFFFQGIKKGGQNDRRENGKMILNGKKLFELETDSYLAKMFDFEFQHHDHQTSL